MINASLGDDNSDPKVCLKAKVASDFSVSGDRARAKIPRPKHKVERMAAGAHLLGSGQKDQDVRLSNGMALLALHAVPDTWKCGYDGCLNAVQLSAEQMQELGSMQLVHVAGFGCLLHACSSNITRQHPSQDKSC